MENKIDEEIVYCRDCEIYEVCTHEVGKWLGYCFLSQKQEKLDKQKIKDSRKDCEGDKKNGKL